MDQLTKDIIQILAWTVAMGAGIIAAYRGLHELKLSRTQRTLELKWKKAKLAKEIINEFESLEQFRTAHQLLAWNARDYTIDGVDKVNITFAMVLESLRTERLNFSKTERFIRDSLILYFDSVSRLEHYIRRDLVDFEDVRLIFEYAISRIQSEREVFDQYLSKYHTDGLAVGFLNRYEPCHYEDHALTN